MLGLIMPQPLAAKPSLTLPSGVLTSRAPYLACLSVVRMAVANWSEAFAPAPPGRAAAAAAMPGSIFSIGRCTPISPVEHTATCSTGSRRWLAVSSRIRAASASPCLPVQALALPALTTTACRWAQSLVSRVSRTGAAAAALLVNVAAETAGCSLSSRPRSSLPLLLDAAGDAGGEEPLRGGHAAADLRREGGQRGEAALRQHQTSPSCSGRPSMTFMFCTAWPEAPFIRLSMTLMTTIRPARASTCGKIRQ